MSYPFHTKRCKSWFINPELDFTSWILNTESLRELHEGQMSSLFSEAILFFFSSFLLNQMLNMFCTLLFSWSFCTRSCILSAFHCYAFKNWKWAPTPFEWWEGGRNGAGTAKIIITPPCSGLTCQTFPFLLPLSILWKICQPLDALKSCLFSKLL